MGKLVHLKTHRSFEDGVVDIMFEFSTRGYVGLERYSKGQTDQETRDMLECGRAFCIILRDGRKLFASGKRNGDDDRRVKICAYEYMMEYRTFLERRGYNEERIFSETAEIRNVLRKLLSGKDVDEERLQRYKEFFHIVGLPYHYRKLLMDTSAKLPKH